MNFNWVGWLITAFIGITQINRVLDGTIFTSADTAYIAGLRITQEVSLGFFHMTIPNLTLLTELTKMADWEHYTIWGTGGQLLMVFLYALSIVILLSLVITIASVLVNVFRPR